MQNYGVFLAISYDVIGRQGDALWNKSDDDFAKFAVDELAKIDIIEKHDNMIRYPVLLYVLHMIAVLETTTLWFDKVCAISAPGFTPGWHLIRLGRVNKSSSIFGWLRLRLAVSAKLGLPTSRPAFCFLASLVLAGAKTKPNFFTSP
jgi:hypothetical protein